MGSRPLEVADDFEANELFGRNGWTDALAHACGLAGYPYAVIPHPIAPNDDEALRRKAAAAVTRCVELLTRR